MTRDELRAKCVEAMADALHDMTDNDPFTLPQELRIATFMFDSVNGVAFVDPLEATAEMIETMAAAMFDCYRGYNEETQKMMWEREKSLLMSMADRAYRAMAAAGDLTNPPKGEP